MKTIAYKSVVTAVRKLCHEAAFNLPADVTAALKRSARKETSARGRSLLSRTVENAAVARRERIPICQDTGLAVFFAELGSGVCVTGGTLTDAINEGTRLGYAEGFLRPSLVDDPVYQRKNTFTNTPATVHCSLVSGNALTLTLAPKGGGSENMTGLFMLKPSEGEAGVVTAALATIVRAGGNPCPPVIVGIGIGGTAETALLLSKKALLRPVGKRHPARRYASLERSILDKVNSTGVGPGGLGGSVTALDVHIETSPCHIATMPVAISLSCHAARHATVTL
jgi:fumarate hydratase subunit alpha